MKGDKGNSSNGQKAETRMKVLRYVTVVLVWSSLIAFFMFLPADQWVDQLKKSNRANEPRAKHYAQSNKADKPSFQPDRPTQKHQPAANGGHATSADADNGQGWPEQWKIWRNRLIGDPIAVGTFILALLTLGILIVYALLLVVGIFQTAAMINAAKAAKQSADATRDTLRVHRPYLEVGRWNLLQDPNWINFKCAISNSGATPAIVRAGVICWCVASKLPEVPDYDSPSKHVLPQVLITPAKPLRAEMTVTPEERLRMIEGFHAPGGPNGWLYVYSRVVYSDIFGDTHETGWARRFDGHRPDGEPRFSYQENSAYDYDK